MKIDEENMKNMFMSMVFKKIPSKNIDSKNIFQICLLSNGPKLVFEPKWRQKLILSPNFFFLHLCPSLTKPNYVSRFLTTQPSSHFVFCSLILKNSKGNNLF
jgi:hypothetical protein